MTPTRKYLDAPKKSDAVNPFVVLWALLLYAFLIGLLVEGNLWIWGEIF